VDLDFGCGFGMQSPHPKMLIIPLEIMWGLDCGCGWRTRCEREKKKGNLFWVLVVVLLLLQKE